ncbi:phage virion morphogenesis protein [Bartonella sp. B10834G6]|uniref:phage virion morphogenesis protein n=1 Tax=Bartonella apis TaxID=1686310 RepID=UPI0018DE2CF6|nr:phage virion morphogenesis protein [Bartonella apis]MBH9981806.1 phage virion morphogenesis protein [Bartonella apis]
MAVEIKLVLTDGEQQRVDRVLDHLLERAKDVSGALALVGEALLETTFERFSTQTDPAGNKWQPLSELTKKLRGSSSPILNRTGRLKGSIVYQVDGNILKLGPNTIDAAVHQFGATIVPKDKKALRIPTGGEGGLFIKKAVIPSRPYIGFGEKDEQAALDSIEDWFDVEDELNS